MTTRMSLIVAVAVIGLVGCGSPTETGAPETGAPETGTTETQVATAPAPDPGSTPAVDGTVVNVDIAGGVVTPTNGQAQGVVGRPIILMVNSDTAEELHVHSVPEYTFYVQARPGQTFEFTVEVPGRVDVELHHLDRTVVTIDVRP